MSYLLLFTDACLVPSCQDVVFYDLKNSLKSVAENSLENSHLLCLDNHV